MMKPTTTTDDCAPEGSVFVCCACGSAHARCGPPDACADALSEYGCASRSSVEEAGAFLTAVLLLGALFGCVIGACAMGLLS